MCIDLHIHIGIHRRAVAVGTSCARTLRSWATVGLAKLTAFTAFRAFTAFAERARRRGFAKLSASALAGAAALAGAPACHAQAALPDLQTLPVNIVADRLLEGGGGGKYSLSVYTDKGMQPIGKGVQRVSLNSGAIPHPMLGRTRFYMRVNATDPASYVALEIVSTARRCLVTSVDYVLNQAYQMGRIVEITPFLAVNDAARLPRTGEMHSICTADSGELTLYFATPALDMLRMMVISHSRLGRRMAATSFVSEMPINP